MSHSGNQGPDWFFRLVGPMGARSGIFRFGLLVFIVLAIAAAGLLYLR
ncbi:hypothetical protein SAMN03159496_04467 [Rhizobium sp. NFR07]|nr:hypothetical protein SAMN03159496_04467 [Rhizobium sp. NFR07]